MPSRPQSSVCSSRRQAASLLPRPCGAGLRLDTLGAGPGHQLPLTSSGLHAHAPAASPEVPNTKPKNPPEEEPATKRNRSFAGQVSPGVPAQGSLHFAGTAPAHARVPCRSCFRTDAPVAKCRTHAGVPCRLFSPNPPTRAECVSARQKKQGEPAFAAPKRRPCFQALRVLASLPEPAVIGGGWGNVGRKVSAARGLPRRKGRAASPPPPQRGAVSVGAGPSAALAQPDPQPAQSSAPAGERQNIPVNRC